MKNQKPQTSSRSIFMHVSLCLIFLAGLVSAGVVSTTLSGLGVSDPLRHGNLTIFPLTGTGSISAGLVTLDRAIARGYVKVQEKEGGEVNTVRVKNASDHYVFGLAGEIITGAKQNRMLDKDVLLPPRSGWLDVPVYCVEHGRWNGASHEFSSKGQIAAGRVRGKAANTRSQAGVWDEVRANNAELGVSAATERFDAVYEDAVVQKQVAGYRKALEKKVPQLGANVIGVAVAVGNRLVCCDVFGSNALFQKMWPRLLESYVIDAVSRTASGSLNKKDIAEFLAEAARARTVSQPTAGAGQLYRIEGDGVAGQALLFQKGVVHLDLFPAEDGEVSPLRLDIRRQGVRD